MASGDRSRVWFAEMIDRLREGWRADLRIDKVITLSQELDQMLHDIRSERDIRPPMMYCQQCGYEGPQAEPRVSVCATILAAGRFGIADQADVKSIERLWKRHRRLEGLDLYGSPEAASDSEQTETAEPNGCTGHAARAGEP